MLSFREKNKIAIKTYNHEKLGKTSFFLKKMGANE